MTIVAASWFATAAGHLLVRAEAAPAQPNPGKRRDGKGRDEVPPVQLDPGVRLEGGTALATRNQAVPRAVMQFALIDAACRGG